MPLRLPQSKTSSLHRHLRILLMLLFLITLSGCSNSSSNASASSAKQSPSFPFATGGKAILGGTLDAFTSKLGSYTIRTAGTLFGFQMHCDSGKADCEQVSMSPGTNGKGYVDSISVNTPESQRWPASVAYTVCQSYMPSDATFQKEVPVTRENAEIGIDRIYVSASLAKVFTADTFVQNGHHVTLGTFDIRYTDVTAGDQRTYIDCMLAVGINA
jgi:hypothetical protein